jgi:hypothetical protein
MPKKEAPQPLDNAIVEGIKRERSARIRHRREYLALGDIFRQKSYKTRSRLFQKAAEKTGLDLIDLLESIERYHRAENHLIEKNFANIRAKTKAMVHESIKHQKEVRQRYLKTFGDVLKAKAGNPELKLGQPVDHWTEEDFPVPGMYGYGFGEPDHPTYHFSDDMQIEYGEHRTQLHHFYPMGFLDNADEHLCTSASVWQNLILKQNIESGRGDFHVSQIELNLHGCGYSEWMNGETCGPLLRGCGAIGRGVGLNLSLTIFHTCLAGLMETTPVDNEPLYMRDTDHSDTAVVECGTTSYPVDFILASPDRGGFEEVWVHMVLETRVSASNKHGRGELNFSRPDFDGLELGCVTLVGEYRD